MNSHSIRYHQLQNLLHSALLLAGMLALLSFIGWLLSGVTGILWSLLIGGVVVISSSRIPPHLILSLYRARLLSAADAPELYNILHQLAQRASLPYLPRLFILPGRMMNAFTLGQKQNTCIALSQAILNNLDKREVTSVLAHEVAHIHHNDLWVMTFADVLSRLTTLLAFTGYFLILVYLPLFILSGTDIPWLLLIALMLAPNLSALLQLALSRSREYSADIEAVNLTGDPRGLALALTKIEYYQGGWVEQILFPNRKIPDPSLLRTHPQTEERIKRLLALNE